MTIFTAGLVLLFLGFPFYWGAFGHPGLILPIGWSVVVALAMNLRRWRGLGGRHVISFLLTLVVSLAACIAAFELGRALVG